MKHLEHLHQKALIAWAHKMRLPAASDIEDGAMIATYLLAVPNGGRRDAREGARLKAEGVKPGVSDLFLPLRRQGMAGLWLELKAPGEKPTAAQRAWIARMDRAGYLATWCDDWVTAATVIADYVGVPAPIRTIAPASIHQKAA